MATRARGVEEIAVARNLVGLDEPRARDRAARVVVEERRNLRPARQASLLEPEQEDDLEAARPRAEQVEHRHAAGLAAVVAADGRALQRTEDLLRGQRPAEREPALELAGEAANRLERAKVGARCVVDRRSAGARARA